MIDNTVSIVIGSWGSYNECNERALGSKWLDLSNYSDWEEIAEELKNEGFELDGIDEELFIQDIDGLPSSSVNWDNVNPQELFELLKESGVLDKDYKYEILSAYLEIYSLSEFFDLVRNNGANWDNDINIYPNRDWYDLGYELLHDCYTIPDYLDNYIDYERFGSELRFDGYHEYSNGIIEIR